VSIDSTQLGAFLVALVALVASPGPATLGLAATGAAFGFRAATRFLAGALCGTALTIVLVGSGVLGALLTYPGIAPLLIGAAVAYIVYLAYRIATAPALDEQAALGRTPGFRAGLLLAVTNPKGYAVFATLFSGFVIVPDDVLDDSLFKGAVLMTLLTMIDSSWLFAGGALRHLFHDPTASRRINYAFAILLLVSVAMAVTL
jgi:threonine/homoserine/homoserine lactone efflux protein